MIKLDKLDITGLEHAVRGMRNSTNSYNKSDNQYTGYMTSESEIVLTGYAIGKKDKELAKQLCKAETDYSKFMRMINVYVDITAPQYWWKEFNTYYGGVEKSLYSFDTTIIDKPFTIDDFSHEHLGIWQSEDGGDIHSGMIEVLQDVVRQLNYARSRYLETNEKEKNWWWQILQLLPTSYNEKRTVMMSYEALVHIYKDKKAHRLDEWNEFCKWIEDLPYNELIREDN